MNSDVIDKLTEKQAKFMLKWLNENISTTAFQIDIMTAYQKAKFIKD